jgi:hypothetical protein
MFGLSLHGWENAMVVALIIAGFFALIAGAATWSVVRLQRIELVESAKEFEKYKLETSKEISQANARTKESELALAELSSPRRIDFSSFKKALEGVSPANVEILYAESCSDCHWLAQWISNFLGTQGGLGWPIDMRPLVPPTSGPFVGLPPTTAVHANPWGITVVANGDSSDWNDASAASSLFRALASSMGKRTHITGSLDTELSKGSVRIVVAPKA